MARNGFCVRYNRGMGLLQRIFGTAEERHDKRLALQAWAQDCAWPHVHLQAEGHVWLNTGFIYKEGVFQGTHISAYKSLKRLDLVKHWIPFLERDAIRMVHENKSMLRHWAHIEHPDFWRELAALLTAPLQPVPYPARTTGWDGSTEFRVNVYWSEVLDEAGKCGNLAPFDVAPTRCLARYAQKEGAHHPRVGLWLCSRGLRTMEQLHADIDKAYAIEGDEFGSMSHERSLALEYVVDWCEVLLRDCNLDLGQKVGVVGQALLAFGSAVWEEHLEPIFRPYIEGIDVQLLHVVCKAMLDCDANITLDRTVWLATQNPRMRFDPQRVDSFRYDHPWPNTGLGVLLDYTPPQTRLDLYFLARRVREGELGIAPSDMLELPVLG